MSHQRGEKSGSSPKPGDQPPSPAQRPKHPFEPAPAFYKPDEVIKTWKPPAEKRNRE